MFFSKKKAFIQNYNAEIKKQTDAYSYELKEYENILGGVLKSSPLFLIAEYNKRNSRIRDSKNADSKINDSKINASKISDDDKQDSRFLIFAGKNMKFDVDTLGKLFENVSPESADIIYCDEDYCDEDKICNCPHLKAEWSPHTLLNENYIGNFFAVKESLLERCKINLLDIKAENEDELSAKVYEILLILSENTNKVRHVSKTLIHIDTNGRFSDNTINSESLYQTYYKSQNTKAMTMVREKAFLRRGYNFSENEKVSIIIPSKDNSEVLIKCLESIENRTKYDNDKIEIIIVDNGSSKIHKSNIEEYIAANRKYAIKYIYEPMEFNFSYMCNRGVKEASGNFFLFMNDDIEVISNDYLNKMLLYARREEVGAVGIKLLYPDSSLIQHIGVCDLDCGPTHKLSHHNDKAIHYFGVNRFSRNVYAVTGACMLVDSEKYFKVGGFHDKMKVGYNDIDLCLKLYEKGYFNVVVNDSYMYHHESLSRGEDSLSDVKYERLTEERKLFYSNHPNCLSSCDPFYHPDLIQDSIEYRINIKGDYEDRFLRVSPISSEDFNNNQYLFLKHAHFNIEEIAFERGLLAKKESSDCYRITGWGLIDKKDNRLFKKYFVLMDEKGNSLYFPVFEKYREDVEKVFPKAKEAKLSGFVIRIDQSYILENQTYRLGMAYESCTSKKKYITMGGLYATNRGIFTEEA